MTSTATAAPGGDLLTLDELAHRLKMHPDTVRGLWRRRSIPALRIGHRTLRFEYGAVLDALRQAGDPAANQAE
jgi:excisionase family DNA binding protein